MRALIIGGTGFIGSALRDELLARGISTSTIARSVNTIAHKNLRHISSSLENFSLIREEISKADVVFHLAHTNTPASAEHNWNRDISDNLLPLTEIIKACAQRGSKLIFASSGGTVYGKPTQIPTPEFAPTNPIGVYGLTKLMSENALRFGHVRSGIPTSILRIANPFGPAQTGEKGQGVIGRFLRSAIDRMPFEIWGDGSIVRDYVYIDDVVSALLLAADKCSSFHIYNVGSGVGRSLIDIVDSIERVVGTTLGRTFSEQRQLDVPVSILDIAKIQEEIGWKPDLDFESHLRLTFDGLTARH
ncbi:NAD-dependent epimerase/dehydratase family protein [Aquamicrobium sp. LC103]|uniref:NAD-dependent epimerase/dehydratase family protein n=1 Tax=Aquamicrobium sp. LC103 TaxID=1120658 RepID=UPI00063E896C|nr:NAD-dependent epimerase/dehydratase family protein [Aquamicrobium sp. LC103]